MATNSRTLAETCWRQCLVPGGAPTFHRGLSALMEVTADARSETVRAVVLTKPKTLEAREFPRPAIGGDDALLRIEACGICGSD